MRGLLGCMQRLAWAHPFEAMGDGEPELKGISHEDGTVDSVRYPFEKADQRLIKIRIVSEEAGGIADHAEQYFFRRRVARDGGGAQRELLYAAIEQGIQNDWLRSYEVVACCETEARFDGQILHRKVGRHTASDQSFGCFEDLAAPFLHLFLQVLCQPPTHGRSSRVCALSLVFLLGDKIWTQSL